MSDYSNCYGLPKEPQLTEVPVRLRKNGKLGFISVYFPGLPLKSTVFYDVTFIFGNTIEQKKVLGKQLELITTTNQ